MRAQWRGTPRNKKVWRGHVSTDSSPRRRGTRGERKGSTPAACAVHHDCGAAAAAAAVEAAAVAVLLASARRYRRRGRAPFVVACRHSRYSIACLLLIEDACERDGDCAAAHSARRRAAERSTRARRATLPQLHQPAQPRFSCQLPMYVTVEDPMIAMATLGRGSSSLQRSKTALKRRVDLCMRVFALLVSVCMRLTRRMNALNSRQ